jgi:hypothetical protein
MLQKVGLALGLAGIAGGWVFRVIPATDSDRILPPIPNESGHPFRGKWPPIPTKTATPRPEGAGSVLDAG